MKTGIYERMPHDEYLAVPAVSNSGLKAAAKSMWHYRMLSDDRPKPEKAPAAPLFAGTLMHCALLENAEFARRFPVGPEVSKNSKVWKDYVASLGADVTPISAVQAQTALLQAQTLRREKNVAEIFSLAGANEVSVFWTDEATGLLCKARPDRVVHTDAGVILFDAKTSQDASRKGFARAVANYSYAQQAAWYARGWNAATGDYVCGMVFGVVESEFPHAAAAYMLEDVAVEEAEAGAEALLRLIAQCTRTGDWPSYPDGMSEPLALPAWARGAREEIYV